MQGDDLKNIKEGAQKARAALAGKNLVPGRAVQVNKAQAGIVNLPATPAPVPAPAPVPTQAQAPEVVQNSTVKLRQINKDELAIVIGYLKTGSYSMAISYLSERTDVDLNDKDMLNKFDEAINLHLENVRKKRLAWRSAPWELQNEMEKASIEANHFKRFLKNEHAKRTHTESIYRTVVTAYQELKELTPTGQFFQQLVNYLSHQQFNFATQLLHTHESKRFVINEYEKKFILSAYIVAKERFLEEREDNVRFSDTVAASRREEQKIADFEEGLNKFNSTLAQYVDGAPLTQFEAPSPYRYHNFDSTT
ncbi:MAG: hypothetical protein AB7V32_08035 [Candidatus Berkiella sp.]